MYANMTPRSAKKASQKVKYNKSHPSPKVTPRCCSHSQPLTSMTVQSGLRPWNANLEITIMCCHQLLVFDCYMYLHVPRKVDCITRVRSWLIVPSSSVDREYFWQSLQASCQIGTCRKWPCSVWNSRRRQYAGPISQILGKTEGGVHCIIILASRLETIRIEKSLRGFSLRRTPVCRSGFLFTERFSFGG